MLKYHGIKYITKSIYSYRIMGVHHPLDALMALPGLIIALAIMAVLGASLNNVIIAIVVGMLEPAIRTVRSQVLSLKELDYVLAARAVGA